MLPIVVILNVVYIYFWGTVIYARWHKHIDKTVVSKDRILIALSKAMRLKNPYLFTIQITTKGGAVHVVKRGIDNILLAAKKYPVLRNIVTVEVITESQDDIDQLSSLYGKSLIPVALFKLPPDYETKDKTKFKARALHYMVEQHRLSPRDSYIVHYDEESVFTPDNLARLVINLMDKPIGISEGTISYALDWRDSHLMCRTMESNRPFGCHECYLMMTKPAPLHLHGSNMVIQEKLENEIGWDIGQYKNNPLIAEDLVFGLMVYIKYGAKVFGWHGVEMIEQPPFTIKAAYKQRERWIIGALQGVNHVASLPGWSGLPLLQRLKIQVLIRFRVITYALGFPVSILSLYLLASTIAYNYVNLIIGFPIELNISLFAIPGLLMWLGSNQIGLAQNLSYTDYTVWEKIKEHIKVLVMTPFSGIYDTSGPFVAVVKWVLGYKTVEWKTTPKLVGQEFGDNDQGYDVDTSKAKVA
jgi:hypothetical protein